MDLVFKRYASPFLFLDTLISNGEFSKGITDIWDAASEDKVWELYLHRPVNKSWDDFRKEAFDETQEITVDELETTVNNSKFMLQGFDPTEGK